MDDYNVILSKLFAQRDDKFRVFNEKIVNVKKDTCIGVRIPLLRKFAKQLVCSDDFSFETLFSFPNDYFEIRVLKCICVGYARMPYPERVELIRRCISVVDGWAVCDVFCSTLKSLKKYRDEYMDEIRRFVSQDSEFSQRFAYVMLLGLYMDENYLSEIFSLLDEAKTEYYYTMMGAAWLLAEVLVKFNARGVEYLQTGKLSENAKRKAIQKACESYRLEADQKKYLKSLKN